MGWLAEKKLTPSLEKGDCGERKEMIFGFVSEIFLLNSFFKKIIK